MLPVSDFKLHAKNKSKFNLIGAIKVKLLVGFTLFVIALFTTQLVFASNLAVDGQKISEIDKQIDQLEAENTTIRVEIAKESSLSSLYSSAQKMGYKSPKDVIAN